MKTKPEKNTKLHEIAELFRMQDIGTISQYLREADDPGLVSHALYLAALNREDLLVDDIVGLLGDPRPEVRAAAAMALSRIRSDRGGAPLVAAARDEDPRVRRWAVRALGQLRDEKWVDAIRTALSDPDDQVRYNAAWALARVGGAQARTALKDAARGERRWRVKRRIWTSRLTAPLGD